MASGDPFAKSVILWTRVTPTNKRKPATLDYAVATDKKFKKIVTRGTTITNADVDFTAKVRVDWFICCARMAFHLHFY